MKLQKTLQKNVSVFYCFYNIILCYNIFDYHAVVVFKKKPQRKFVEGNSPSHHPLEDKARMIDKNNILGNFSKL